MILIATDLLWLFVALLGSCLFGDLTGRKPDDRILEQFCGVIFVTVVVFAADGLYPAFGTNGLVESKRLFRCIGFVQNCSILILWTLGARGYEGPAITFWALSILAVLTGRSLCRSLLSSKNWWGEPVVLIGSSPEVEEVAELLCLDVRLGLHVAAVLHEDGLPNRSTGVPVFQTLDELAAFVRRKRIQTGLVTLNEVAGVTVSGAISKYECYFTRLIVLPVVGQRRSSSSRAKVLSGQLSMEASLVTLMRNRRMIKRCLDLTLALSAGLLLLPVIVLIAIAVKLSSPGPIFFGHRRIGRNGATFLAWKFRTMVVGADVYLAERLASSPALREEWERDHKLRNDPRVTKVGAVLRKYSLDELPQLWNALCSEMSIVGPRPIIAEEVARYADCFHCYSRVLPGITGLWQISGRNETTYDERVELDTYYVNSWSLWLDLYILCRSVGVVLLSRGAY